MLIIVLVGMYYPVKECIDYAKQDDIKNFTESWEYEGGTMEVFANPEVDIIYEDGLKYNYYTYDLENSIFYRYFARIKVK